MSFSKLEAMDSQESTNRLDSGKELSSNEKKFLKKGEQSRKYDPKIAIIKEKERLRQLKEEQKAKE